MISRYGWIGSAGCSGARSAADGERPRARARRRAAARRRPARGRIVFLGTSLTAGLGLDPGSGLSRPDPGKLDSAGLRVRGGQRRRERGDIGRRPPADRLAAAAAGGGAGDRDRRQRRTPRPRGPDSLRGQHPGDHRPGGPADAEAAGSCSWGCGRRPTYGAELRPEISARSTRSWPRRTTCRWCRFCSRDVAGVASLNQADMIHPTAGRAAASWRRRCGRCWSRCLEGRLGLGRRLGAQPFTTSPSAATAASISSAVL